MIRNTPYLQNHCVDNEPVLKNVAFVIIGGCICSLENGVYFWNGHRLGTSVREAKEKLKELANQLIKL